MIRRHGIYNPTQVVVPSRASCYMAPHNVRDVLAAHILQQTGSYEQASPLSVDTRNAQDELSAMGFDLSR